MLDMPAHDSSKNDPKQPLRVSFRAQKCIMRARAGSLTGHFTSQFAALAAECYIGNTDLLQVERSRQARFSMICAARMRTAVGLFPDVILEWSWASGVSVWGVAV